MVEGERPRRERDERPAHVGVARVQALGEEGLHRAVRRAHLAREVEEAGHVAAVEPPVAEGPELRGQDPRLEARDRLGGARAEGVEHRRDAALDLRDGPEGEPGGQEADHLAVGVRHLGAHELQRVRRDEPVVVLPVQLLEAEPEVLAAHGGTSMGPSGIPGPPIAKTS